MSIKNIFLFGLAAVILIQAGCSATPTHSAAPAKFDNDLIYARSFSFVAQGPKPMPLFAATRTTTHDLIQAAITQDFADRGVVHVASGGDITVEYLIIIGDATATEVLDDYFGQGGEADSGHDKAREAYANANDRKYLNTTTLVIDLIDTKDHKLLASQEAKRPFHYDTTPEERAARTRQMVDEIFRSLKIANPK